MKHLLEILSLAKEFESLPIRDSDEGQLQAVANYLEYRVDSIDGIYCDPRTKANILLQCHFLRKDLSIDLSLDQKEILEQSLKLVHAMVEMTSTEGWLNLTLLAMELSQMIVQACLIRESQLYQLPYFDQAIVERCKNNGIKDIGDLLEMEDEPRRKLLNMSDKQLEKVAQVSNKIPNYSIVVKGLENGKEEATVGDEVNLIVEIKDNDDEGEDEEEEDDDDKIVYAPFYPQQKHEQWWLIVGDEKEKALLGIKRITAKARDQVQLRFTPRDKGNKKYTVFLICDSYTGCDTTENFNLMIYDQQAQ